MYGITAEIHMPAKRFLDKFQDIGGKFCCWQPETAVKKISDIPVIDILNRIKNTVSSLF